MKTRELTRTAVFTALTCAAAIIFRYVPATLVPYSILPLMVLLSGFLLGPRLGAWAMTAYAMLGIIGFPVFATAPFGGVAYVLKPTFGFILGYIPAALVVGIILKTKKNPGIFISALAVLAGISAIYLVGLSYFYLILNLVMHKPTSMYTAVKVAFLPFISLDLIKGAVAVIIGRLLSVRLPALETARSNN